MGKPNFNTKNLVEQICAGLWSFVYICITTPPMSTKLTITSDIRYFCGRYNYQDGEGLHPINGFAPPHFFACPKPEPGFPMSYVTVCFMFNYFMWEMIVTFIDIGGVVDHHCLNFLFVSKNLECPNIQVSSAETIYTPGR